MKKTYFKNVLKLISDNPRRFLALICIVAIGVAFYAGVRAASPDMQLTVQDYFEKSNVYDFRLVSMTGFSESDVEEIKKREGVEDVLGEYSYDAVYNANVFSLISIDTEKLNNNDASLINRPKLVLGRYPENDYECLIDKGYFLSRDYEIGDKITFTSGDETDINNYLEIDEFTITGFAESPLYITFFRGPTRKGSGNIRAFVYVSENVFKAPVYTTVYVTVSGGKDFLIFGDDYFDYIKPTAEKIEALGKERSIPGTPGWYVLNLNANHGFASYKQDTERVAAIGKVFPLIFFLVAILVSLTNMTRMVEADRACVGVFKALGYGNGPILFKYMFYSTTAGILGSGAGLLIGLNLFPRVIAMAYGIMYTAPPILLYFNADSSLTAIAGAMVCVMTPAFLVCIAELFSPPANLMRPKAPKEGKRIFLEYIGFIWNRINFSKKVAARNIFRYKKRLIMTIIGISGCTALMFTGFGLKDSISLIIGKQYDEIQIYDFRVGLERVFNESDKSIVEEYLNENIYTGEFTYISQQAVDASANDVFKSALLVGVQKDQDLSEFITLINRKSREKLSLSDEGVIVSEKLCALLGLKTGDYIDLTDADGYKVSAKIAGITENYPMHYVYMSAALYDSLFGSPPVNNVMLVKYTDLGKAEADE